MLTLANMAASLSSGSSMLCLQNPSYSTSLNWSVDTHPWYIYLGNRLHWSSYSFRFFFPIHYIKWTKCLMFLIWIVPWNCEWFAQDSTWFNSGHHFSFQQCIKWPHLIEEFWSVSLRSEQLQFCYFQCCMFYSSVDPSLRVATILNILQEKRM